MRWLYLILLSLGLTSLIWVFLGSDPAHQKPSTPGTWRSESLPGETYRFLRTPEEIAEASQTLPPPVAQALGQAQAPLLLAYLGLAPSGGYSITITRVEMVGEEMVVTVSRRSPSPEAMVIMVLTHSFDLVTVDLKPRGVRFQTEQGELLFHQD